MSALVGTGIAVLLVTALACGPALLDRSRRVRRRAGRIPLTPIVHLREGQLTRVAGRIELLTIAAVGA